MKAFFATALLATTGLAAKHSLMSYDKSSTDNWTLNTADDGSTYYSGFATYSFSDVYFEASQPVDWTDDSTGIYFEQLAVFEAASVNTITFSPNTNYLSISLAATFLPFSFSFFDNVLTVTLGDLADLTSAEGFSVCDTLGWSYDIL
jgi:hypothetical protein